MASRSAPIPPFAPTRYRVGQGSRWSGIGGALAVYGLAGAVLLVTLTTRFVPPPPPATLTVMAVRQPTAAPRPRPRPKPAPHPLRKVQPVHSEPLPIVHPIVPTIVALPAAPLKPVDPPPVQAEVAAPAPPAPQMASTAPDSWEGRVLTQLSKSRRYPGAAMARREQGVPTIRFVMDRQGRVLSVSLERTSGYDDLDREALALPRRAQPLPKPPADRAGDTLELVVPVAFFIK
jgi:periplasmic protein TonB